MRQHYNQEFYLHWFEYYQSYIGGEWDKAISMLEKLDSINDKDGPTNAIRKYMLEECKGVCPANWPGYRETEF